MTSMRTTSHSHKPPAYRITTAPPSPLISKKLKRRLLISLHVINYLTSSCLGQVGRVFFFDKFFTLDDGNDISRVFCLPSHKIAVYQNGTRVIPSLLIYCIIKQLCPILNDGSGVYPDFLTDHHLHSVLSYIKNTIYLKQKNKVHFGEFTYVDSSSSTI